MGKPAHIEHRPFTLVLGGGGARGFAHAGVLRALEHEGYRPSAIVGVSMGAVVGVTYALRPDWYTALLAMDTGAFPGPLSVHETKGLRERAQVLVSYAQAARDLLYDWGPGVHALAEGKDLLRTLTQDQNLEACRLPVAVSTTDLNSGKRHVIHTGNAAEALYASSALAGVLPPLPDGDRLLADGAYADIAPIDVARSFGFPLVLAVDPGQALLTMEVKNGYQALMRAMEICHIQHADMCFAAADLVLKPPFPRTIDTLDFGARRTCTAAGIRAVRQHRPALAALLRPDGLALQDAGDRVDPASHSCAHT